MLDFRRAIPLVAFAASVSLAQPADTTARRRPRLDGGTWTHVRGDERVAESWLGRATASWWR
jgi:hypothetical protein